MGKSKNYLNIDNYKYVPFFGDIYFKVIPSGIILRLPDKENLIV